MGKIIPLLLSTLTLLSTGLYSTAWADTSYSETGPWTFDEMLTAEKETQDTINSICPYDPYPSNCATQYVYGAIAPAPIYTRLGQFEASQFHIISIDTSNTEKNVMEAYFRDEDNFEKYYSDIQVIYDEQTGEIISKSFNGVTYKHKITKLYVVQPEKDYLYRIADGNFEDDLSHWNVLYYNAKPEGEESLFPIEEKFSFEMNPLSRDEKYERMIEYIYEDEVGNWHYYLANVENCHLGGEICKAEYNMTDSWSFLVNKPTYEDGYSDGYEVGLREGRIVGYGQGYIDGQNDGYDDGYNNGVEDGYVNGRNDGMIVGYNNGLAEGYNTGMDEGYSMGRDEAYGEGYTDGMFRGYDEGYLEGYNVGWNDGSVSNEDDGKSERNDEENLGDGSENEDGNGAPTTQNYTINVSLNNENVLKTKSNTALESTVQKKGISAPNTGVFSGGESSVSVEFPWWMVVIIALGFTTLAWFFSSEPKNGKETKK